MSTKVVLLFCAQSLFLQLVLSACAGRPNLGAGLASYGLSTPINPGLCRSSCAAPPFPTSGCSGFGYNGIGYGNRVLGSSLGYGSNLAIDAIPTFGGSFPVTCSSSISPIGVSIISDNVIEGALYVCGELPFTSAVALEGGLPSTGAGAVSHSCGDRVTAFVPAYGSGIEVNGAGLGVCGGTGGIEALSLLPGGYYNALLANIVAFIDSRYPPGIYY